MARKSVFTVGLILLFLISAILVGGTHVISLDSDSVTAVEELNHGTDPLSADTDNDGLWDGVELDKGTSPTIADSDDDGLKDGAEVKKYGSDPNVVDTDNDGLTDGLEVNEYGTDPTLADTDQDGLNDRREVDGNTDATVADTDDDGLSDQWEAEGETDATVADTDDDGLSDGPELNEYGTDPTEADTDNDGLPDGSEVNEYGTDPTLADTDGDGLNDLREVEGETNSRLADTDDDGLADGPELNRYGTNPTVFDTDDDGLADGLEVKKYGSDPTVADTDDDTLSDGAEVNGYGTDPVRSDTDGDGLADQREVEGETDATVADTDNDGLEDGREVLNIGTDPTDSDTDGDGILDGTEVLGDGLYPDAKPLKKDIYLEVDYMPGLKSQIDTTPLKREYAQAPIENPDGTNGIRLHVVWDDEVPFRSETEWTDREGELNDVDDFRDRYADKYDIGYRYALVVNDVTKEGDDFGGVASVTSSGGGKYFISEADLASFSHELGHSVGLAPHVYSGIDSTEYSRREYPSVMNYEVNTFIGYSHGTNSPEDHDDWAVIERDFNKSVSPITFYPGYLGISFAGGDGSVSDPYQIANANQLRAIEKEPNAHYILVSDIDLSSSENFDPIGGYPNNLNGSFDGNGHTISNLTIQRDIGDLNERTTEIGLFSTVDEARIENVRLENISVQGHNNVGGLAGVLVEGEIVNVTVSGNVTGTDRTGGIVGNSRRASTIRRVESRVTVKADNMVGGIAGVASGKIRNSYATGTVTYLPIYPGTDGEEAGGLVGGLWGEIDTSYSAVTLNGFEQRGGLVGETYNGTITDSYWDKETAGIGSSAGSTSENALTTKAMTGSKAKENLDGFDFGEIWRTSTEYPALRWQISEPSN